MFIKALYYFIETCCFYFWRYRIYVSDEKQTIKGGNITLLIILIYESFGRVNISKNIFISENNPKRTIRFLQAVLVFVLIQMLQSGEAHELLS